MAAVVQQLYSISAAAVQKKCRRIAAAVQQQYSISVVEVQQEQEGCASATCCWKLLFLNKRWSILF